MDRQMFGETIDGKVVAYYLDDSGNKVYPDNYIVEYSFKQSDSVSQVSPTSVPSVTPTSFPSMTQMAKNFAGTMTDFVKSGFKIADNYEERWATCKVCDQFKDNRCLQCGCWMENKAKIEAAKCPLAKW